MPTLVPMLAWSHAGVALLLAASTTAPSRVAGWQSSPRPTAQAGDSPAVGLTVSQLKTRLAAATQSAPADLSNTDLSGRDLAGLGFKHARLTDGTLRNAKLAGASLLACDRAG